jgi:hypothetical protein
MGESTLAELDSLRVGADLNGYKVCNIVGKNDQFVVCTVELKKPGDVGIHWKTAKDIALTDQQRAYVHGLNIRYDPLKKAFPDDATQVEALAAAFYYGLCTPESSPEIVFARLDECLAEARKDASNRSRVVYGAAAAGAALVAVLAFSMLIAFTHSNAKLTGMELEPLYVAAVFGALGALASILQKLPSIEVSHYPGFQSVVFGGVARVLLGSLFGATMFLGATVGVLLSALIPITGGVPLIGLLGGISERLVPELISQFETSQRS